MGSTVYLALIVVWAAAAAATGALLALLARRMHPALSFRKLWVFYAALMGFLVGVVLIVGLR